LGRQLAVDLCTAQERQSARRAVGVSVVRYGPAADGGGNGCLLIGPGGGGLRCDNANYAGRRGDEELAGGAAPHEPATMDTGHSTAARRIRERCARSGPGAA